MNATHAKLVSLGAVLNGIGTSLPPLSGSPWLIIETLAEGQRPEFWDQLWERYVESKLDYKSTEETLQIQTTPSRRGLFALLEWLEPLGAEVREAKGVALLRQLFSQQHEVEQGGKIEPVQVHGTGIIQNPHDPEAQWSAKSQGKQKKDWVGYKVQ